MDGNHAARSWPLARHLSVGLAALASLTWLCFQLDSGLGTAGFLQLIALTLLSIRGSFAGAAILSVVAFVCLNYFFAEPVFALSPLQVSVPFSPGPGIVQNCHALRPVFMSNAIRYPR